MGYRLTATILTRNEAHNIVDCLASLAGLADEIIVLDSGSTDATRALAREHGATVIEDDGPWPGFGPQKARALAHAQGDWVLSIDADERVTPALKVAIEQAISAGTSEVYALPRRSQFCGRFIDHAGWYPDYVVRLFKRGSAQFSADLVHEKLLYQGECGRLATPLLHYSYRDYSDVLRKVESYSTAGARQAFAAGKRTTPWSAFVHGGWAFVRTYLLRRGFLDGSHGFGVACMNAQASYYKYMKLWHLSQAKADAATATQR